MASGSKERSVFTGNPMGGSPGSSDMVTTKSGGNVGGGGKIKSAYPQDNVHGLDLPDTKGGKMGGSPTNLSHSLSGASAVQRQTGKVKNGI
jgi:hypothetical protein